MPTWDDDTYRHIDVIAADQVFASASDIVINIETRSISLSSSGVYFAFHDHGACATLLSVRIYYVICPTTTLNYAFFPNATTGSELSSIILVSLLRLFSKIFYFFQFFVINVFFVDHLFCVHHLKTCPRAFYTSVYLPFSLSFHVIPNVWPQFIIARNQMTMKLFTCLLPAAQTQRYCSYMPKMFTP